MFNGNNKLTQTIEIPINTQKIYKLQIKRLKNNNVPPKLNYKQLQKYAYDFKKEYNINENGMWLLFDCDITSTFYLHYVSLNIIHIFNDENKKKYIYKYNPDLLSQSYSLTYTWLNNYYKTLQIYKTNYGKYLIELLETNNPITYITFTTLFQNELFSILELCKSQLYIDCIIILKKYPEDYKLKMKKWGLKNNIETSIIVHNEKYMVFRIITNTINNTTINIYNKYDKSVKVINKRSGGFLWHFGHFYPDCIVDEFRELHNKNIENVIRIDDCEQSIGTFSKYYEKFMGIPTNEQKIKDFNKIYCSTTLITGKWQGPYPPNYFDNIYKYGIKSFYNKSQQKYDVILIERGLEKLKYSIADVNNFIMKNRPEDVKYKIIKNGKERRYINNHNDIKEFLANKYKSAFANIILENSSIEYQITLFQNAKIIIAQHGASLFNLIYCKPTTSIIEICPILVPVFKNIANVKKLNHQICKNDSKTIIKLFDKY